MQKWLPKGNVSKLVYDLHEEQKEFFYKKNENGIRGFLELK
jgi:hypothetical protein